MGALAVLAFFAGGAAGADLATTSVTTLASDTEAAASTTAVAAVRFRVASGATAEAALLAGLKYAAIDLGGIGGGYVESK